MLEIKNIYKTFNPGTINEKVALNGLSLKLNEGDFVTVIGGNGAGKSTMLNAVAGVWPVDEGQIIIDGTDVGTCILSYEMPNGERMTLTYVRNPSVTHVNFIYMDCLYETDQGDNFTASGYITTQPDDNGCEINVKNLSVMQGDELLGTFSFIGTITKEKNLPDVFRGASLDSPDMEHIDWQTVRDDTEGFIQDVIDEAKKRLTG